MTVSFLFLLEFSTTDCVRQDQLADAESSGRHEEERAAQQREWEQKSQASARVAHDPFFVIFLLLDIYEVFFTYTYYFFFIVLVLLVDFCSSL